MTDELCGARCDFARTHCQAPEGHVQSDTDWHEGAATQNTTERGSRHSIEQISTEVVRWAPASFEVPRKPKTDHENTTKETPNA